MHNIKGYGDETATDTGNTDEISNISYNCRGSEGGEINQNDWHVFQTN